MPEVAEGFKAETKPDPSADGPEYIYIKMGHDPAMNYVIETNWERDYLSFLVVSTQTQRSLAFRISPGRRKGHPAVSLLPDGGEQLWQQYLRGFMSNYYDCDSADGHFHATAKKGLRDEICLFRHSGIGLEAYTSFTPGLGIAVLLETEISDNENIGLTVTNISDTHTLHSIEEMINKYKQKNSR